jgi:hypothetical protein
MKDVKYIYYWYCPICGKEETYKDGFDDLHDAKIELEKHEADKHKKKQIGCYGKAIMKNILKKQP